MCEHFSFTSNDRMESFRACLFQTTCLFLLRETSTTTGDTTATSSRSELRTGQERTMYQRGDKSPVKSTSVTLTLIYVEYKHMGSIFKVVLHLNVTRYKS